MKPKSTRQLNREAERARRNAVQMIGGPLDGLSREPAVKSMHWCWTEDSLLVLYLPSKDDPKRFVFERIFTREESDAVAAEMLATITKEPTDA